MTTFNIGDRVKFVAWHPEIDGTFGTVTERVDTSKNPDGYFFGSDDLYRVRDDNDPHPDWPARLTFANEIELETP